MAEVISSAYRPYTLATFHEHLRAAQICPAGNQGADVRVVTFIALNSGSFDGLVG
jgi:hypothetical protein